MTQQCRLTHVQFAQLVEAARVIKLDTVHDFHELALVLSTHMSFPITRKQAAEVLAFVGRELPIPVRQRLTGNRVQVLAQAVAALYKHHDIAIPAALQALIPDKE